MTDGITIIGNTNIDVIIADTRDLPAPGTERVVSSVSIRLGGSAGNFAVRCAGLDFPTLGLGGLGGGFYYGAERVPASVSDPDVGTKFQSKDPLSRSVIRRNP